MSPCPNPKPQTPNPRRRSRGRGGFTLIEAALATVIIATGVLAIMAAQQAYHKKNDIAQKSSTALLLANELRELTLTMPFYDPIGGAGQIGPQAGDTIATFNDIYDFAGPVTNGSGAGWTFSPPVNALRQQIPNMTGWAQQIKVENILPSDISSTFTQPLGTTDVVRVTVTVTYKGPNDAQPTTLATLSWLIEKP